MRKTRSTRGRRACASISLSSPSVSRSRRIGSGSTIKIDSYFTSKLTKVSNYDFINGWGSNDTPLLVANASDQHVRIPGNMAPHSVAVHPSPKLQAVVGWRSPVAAAVKVEVAVTHAHPECGNGITWSLEIRRGATRQSAWSIWRIVRTINPLTAATYEMRERLSNSLFHWVKGTISGRLVRAYIHEVGAAAIDLYSGELRKAAAERGSPCRYA